MALCALTACGGDSAPAAQRVTIDERAGTYRGVGLLDTRRTVERRFGRAQVNKDGPFEPLNMDFYDATLPTSSGVHDRRPTRSGASRPSRSTAYDGKTFTMAVTAPDAMTQAARRRRQHAGAGAGEVPGAAVRHRQRGHRVPDVSRTAPGASHRRVTSWFGGDPVRSVMLSRKTLMP